MKKIVVIFAAMAAVLSSCSKNELESVSVNDGKDIVLNISVSNPGADDTKAIVKTGWVEGDLIKIWFDTNKGETPDLVIKCDGSNWTQVGNFASTPKSEGSIKAVYNNFVIVASKDAYTYTGNTLSFHIGNWKFLTEIQVVVKGLDYDVNEMYALSCDKFTPLNKTGFKVNADGIVSDVKTKGDPAVGQANADGVAFVFATAEYSSTDADFKFTLKNLLNEDFGTRVYTVKTDKISEVIDHKSIKALTIDIRKFAATKGTAKRTGNVDVKWVQLWAGGPKFAEYNVGVSGDSPKAEDYGGYYKWDNNIASSQWGSNWRMPTQAELSDAKGGLLHECTCRWTTNYKGTGVNGLLCTGKENTAYASNSVFLPAAGDYLGGTVYHQGDYGYYWSSTPEDSGKACRLVFYSGPQYMEYISHSYGSSVRAVLAEED